MTFDTELGERLRATTRSLPDLPDTLDDVMRRGQRRRVSTRVAGVGGVVLVAVVGVVVALAFLDDPVGPIVDDPPVTPDPAVTEDITPEPSEVQVGIVTPGEIEWSLLVAGPDGVTRWRGDDSQVVHPDLAMTAIPLPDGGVLVQELTGEAILRIDLDGARREFVAPRHELRLLGAGTTADGGVVGLITWRTDDPRLADETDEHVGTVDLASGEVTDLGRSGGIQSGLDNIDLADGRLLETSCHLQCSLWRRDLDDRASVFDDVAGEPEAAGWLTGGAWFGDGVAYLSFSDPNHAPDGPFRALVVNGTTVQLPLGPTWPATLSVAPDASAVLVAAGDVRSDDVTTYLVDRLDSLTPRVRRLSLPGIARFESFWDPDG